MSHASPHDRPANRLAQETSPYLLQHAHNPVDWHPWGDEAFAKAAAENKPIFLSVGYSACHWCHVMERESFENEGIAAYLNEHYVSIKVDREERPDVDQIYMSAVQLITRRGGWPMSVFLTPEKKPFYGGTYWPPTSRMGMPGFRDILVKLHDYWVNKRDEVENSADQLVGAIDDLAAPEFVSAELNPETIQQATAALVQSADRVHGGFGGAPKFPHAMDIRVLLRGWKRFGDDNALQTALLTLSKMAHGGIYDHLGGGFHRYSTDAFWLVPHFEKMLYDNALLVPAYLEAFQISRDAGYATVVRETLDYVLREMTAPEGGFYSTQDADSEGVEGKFFVWTEKEILEVLGPLDGELFNDCYDVSPRGNWEGHSILNRPRGWSELAALHGMPLEDLEARLKGSRETLLRVRGERVWPGRDDKILSGWNGMMIAAFAQASLVLDEPRYREAAVKGCEFVLGQMRDGAGRLLHSWKEGRARFAAYLDDYACLIDGLVETFQASGRVDFLDAAQQLAEDAIEHFADKEQGGFFYTANDHEQLITRTKDSQDNATPSGNGMMATALLKLARLTSRADLEESAVRTLDYLSGLLAEHPRAAGQALIALDALLGPSPEIVISDAGDGLADQLARKVWDAFLPNKVYARRSKSDASTLELFAGKESGATSQLFLCDRGACQTPVSDLAEAELKIGTLAGHSS
ncbi:thioredoxin domain-containing protein [Planctomicrobium piriforme]|uniref:Spermatogenesis-associated protein 20-like TRX domain-containing protein n=1 Tax=Planctomicrobium piriforme TaxID=1576369 RepID=A0A1I3G6I6_9PLAN|nr:thioredoxin domain-containing protein [Planctomicrobium piriforme]SFI18872.1 hypothetical protein SAMN05421753_106202 [Planctomicrobium piriforme]